MTDRPSCPFCGSDKVVSQEPQWRCKNCRHAWKKTRDSLFRCPKILLLDIETAPMEVLVWGLYKQRIPTQAVVKEWSMLSWAAKWLFSSEIMGQVVTPEEAINRDDASIIQGIWDLVNAADIVVAHNGQRFDMRRLNTRFKANDLFPPMSYQVIDTMRHAQKSMALSSYKLDYISGLLGGDHKLKTSFELWRQCIGINVAAKQQEQALKRMLKYNKKDIAILEDVYLEIRPWIKSHPNLGLMYDGHDVERCPNCGDTNISWEGIYYTPMGKFRSFRCACGAIGRSRFSSLSAEEKKNLTASVAR